MYSIYGLNGSDKANSSHLGRITLDCVRYCSVHKNVNPVITSILLNSFESFFLFVFVYCIILASFISKWTHWREHKRFSSFPMLFGRSIRSIRAYFSMKSDGQLAKRKNSFESWVKEEEEEEKNFHQMIHRGAFSTQIHTIYGHKNVFHIRTHKHFSCVCVFFFGHKIYLLFSVEDFIGWKDAAAFFWPCSLFGLLWWRKSAKMLCKTRCVQAFTFVQMSNNAFFSHSMIILGDLFASSSWLLKIIPEQIYTNRFGHIFMARSVSHCNVQFHTPPGTNTHTQGKPIRTIVHTD